MRSSQTSISLLSPTSCSAGEFHAGPELRRSLRWPDGGLRYHGVEPLNDSPMWAARSP